MKDSAKRDKNDPVDEIAAIIVTYNPSVAVSNLIRQIREQRIAVIVVDNGSTDGLEYLHQNKDSRDVHTIRLETNRGLAYGQNRGIELAEEIGKRFVVLFDQDSRIESGYFSSMVRFYHTQNTGTPIGLVAPNFYDPNLKTYTRFAKLGRLRYFHRSCGGGAEGIDVSFAVASGSLIPLDVIRRVGMMRESFFIDHVDSDFSLRLLSHGFRIVVNCSVVMNHTIGDRSEHKLLFLTVRPNHHGPFRKYFISRNGFRLLWEYGIRYPSFAVLMCNRHVHDLLGILFFETGKGKKLLAYGKGFFASFFLK